MEYIESTGTQYINTGIKYASDTKKAKYEIDFKRLQGDAIGGLWGGIQSKRTGTLWYTSTGKLAASMGATPSASSDIVITDNGDRHYAIFEAGLSSTDNNIKVVFDDVVYTGKYTYGNEIGIGQEIYLFGGYLFSSYSPRKMKVFSFKIYLDDQLVLSLVPVKRNGDGEIGMYDTVSGTFFTNQGTGEFIAGPVAEIKIATTKFVDDEFAAAEAKLATTVQTIESVVSRTIDQAGDISRLQAEKQTRPDESCPANMKCLLVQDEDGTPHWYPIIEP
ncbi:MAG: hypothetical protein MJ164_01105 [Alphaproteobacteria bacterium]|nr:hypothetical protein [Alphaproteobacteria bacterium]